MEPESKYEYKLEQDYTRHKDSAVAELEKKLNDLGKDGWEFCGEINQPEAFTGRRYLVFKRPVTTS